MNNEPVAWMQIHYKDKMCVTKLSPVKTWEDDVPLYLHPVDAVNISQQYVDKTQNNRHELTDGGIELIKKFQDERDELKAEMPKVFAEGKRLGIIETENRFSKAMSMTNEEILSLWDWNSGEILATDLLDFADAILRKAQEK